MSVDPSQLADLQGVCREARIETDGQYTLVYLAELRFRAGSETVVMDALLCPQEHSSYTTRLFLDRTVPTRGGQWTAHPFLGKQWQACSWQNVPKDQPLLQILLQHLAAFKV
jgi:hypothetical protein